MNPKFPAPLPGGGKEYVDLGIETSVEVGNFCGGRRRLFNTTASDLKVMEHHLACEDSLVV
jgi:hypothetical protein